MWEQMRDIALCSRVHAVEDGATMQADTMTTVEHRLAQGSHDSIQNKPSKYMYAFSCPSTLQQQQQWPDQCTSVQCTWARKTTHLQPKVYACPQHVGNEGPYGEPRQGSLELVVEPGKPPSQRAPATEAGNILSRASVLQHPLRARSVNLAGRPSSCGVRHRYHLGVLPGILSKWWVLTSNLHAFAAHPSFTAKVTKIRGTQYVVLVIDVLGLGGRPKSGRTAPKEFRACLRPVPYDLPKSCLPILSEHFAHP